MKSTFVIRLFALSCAVLLSACSNGVENQDPQGFWKGTSLFGNTVAAVVLENGDYFSLYSTDGVVQGANYGTIQVEGNTFTGTMNDLYIPGNQSNSGTMSGNFVPKASVYAELSYNDGFRSSLTASYMPSYDVPATLSAIAGRYVGPYQTGSNVDFQVDAAGAVNATLTRVGSTVPICIVTGSVKPRASGKAVYDLTLRWNNNPDPSVPRCCSGSVCATDRATTGIALVDSSTGATTLYTAWLNAAGSSGFLWIGLKQ
jgi:hypothetical protein